jgi:hypothetical protein
MDPSVRLGTCASTSEDHSPTTARRFNSGPASEPPSSSGASCPSELWSGPTAASARRRARTTAAAPSSRSSRREALAFGFATTAAPAWSHSWSELESSGVVAAA